MVGKYYCFLKGDWDLGLPPASHLEHLPLTVSPVTGELIMNRRTTLSTLLVFEGLDPERW